MRITFLWVAFWLLFSVVAWLLLFKYGVSFFNWRKRKFVEFCVREWKKTGEYNTPKTRLRLNLDWGMMILIFVLSTVPSFFAHLVLRVFHYLRFIAVLGWYKARNFLRRL